MWDFSWILRHHKFGEFEDWDQVLQELAERGYNAIRMDAMPQFVAADTDGTVSDEFICTSNFTHPQFKGMWNDIAWHRKITKKIKQV
jgi:hypothetical protein